jgi:hypothetical protein
MSCCWVFLIVATSLGVLEHTTVCVCVCVCVWVAYAYTCHTKVWWGQFPGT